MSEQPEDEMPGGERFRGSRNDALLLALGETRAAAKQAADTAARIETAVSGLATRVGALEVDVAAMKATQSAQAAASASEKATRVPLGPAGWVALGISLLTALYLVIDHTPSP